MKKNTRKILGTGALLIIFSVVFFSGYGVKAFADDSLPDPGIPPGGSPVPPGNTEPPAGSGSTTPTPAPTDAFTTTKIYSELKIFDTSYSSQFIKPNGAIISEPGTSCTNGGIGCGQEVTSEAIAYRMRFCSLMKDKTCLDKEINFYYDYMEYEPTGWMMWNVDINGVPKDSVGGWKSSVDSELIAIQALTEAIENGWTADNQGRNYAATRLRLMNSLKGGLVDTHQGKVLAYCIQKFSTEMPCENVVYMGYLKLETLKTMCTVDSFWCPVYDSSKKLMIEAATKSSIGVYSVYRNGGFTFEQAPIYPNWVMEELAEDGSTDAQAAVRKYYDQTKAQYATNGQVCQEFSPTTGCKAAYPPMYVWATYLDMAVAYKDTAFANEMLKVLHKKCVEDGDSVCDDGTNDNYKNIIAGVSRANAMRAGYTIQ